MDNGIQLAILYVPTPGYLDSPYSARSTLSPSPSSVLDGIEPISKYVPRLSDSLSYPARLPITLLGKYLGN
jgi:hypothetical protein